MNSRNGIKIVSLVDYKELIMMIVLEGKSIKISFLGSGTFWSWGCIVDFDSSTIHN